MIRINYFGNKMRHRLSVPQKKLKHNNLNNCNAKANSTIITIDSNQVIIKKNQYVIYINKI